MFRKRWEIWQSFTSLLAENVLLSSAGCNRSQWYLLKRCLEFSSLQWIFISSQRQFSQNVLCCKDSTWSLSFYLYSQLNKMVEKKKKTHFFHPTRLSLFQRLNNGAISPTFSLPLLFWSLMHMSALPPVCSLLTLVITKVLCGDPSKPTLSHGFFVRCQ